MSFSSSPVSAPNSGKTAYQQIDESSSKLQAQNFVLAEAPKKIASLSRNIQSIRVSDEEASRIYEEILQNKHIRKIKYGAGAFGSFLMINSCALNSCFPQLALCFGGLAILGTGCFICSVQKCSCDPRGEDDEADEIISKAATRIMQREYKGIQFSKEEHKAHLKSIFEQISKKVDTFDKMEARFHETKIPLPQVALSSIKK
jgi:hypothetical protein